MELTDETFFSDDDDNGQQGNEELHEKLKNSIGELDKSQRVKPATRNEVGSQVSEFHLSQPRSGAVSVEELAAALKQKQKHTVIGRTLKRVLPKVLPKPLEKPVAQKIKRKIGFELVKNDLSKWDGIVAQNRVATTLRFPLPETDADIKEIKEYNNSLDHFKSPFEKELDELKKEIYTKYGVNNIIKKEDEKNDDKKEFALNLEEMMERRKEMAALRARQSYRESKSARQSKIKSKRYRRILKKEKTKKQLLDFEMLKKMDPEAALKKLQELDKARAEERASLRHKSTGKWAQNRVIRAKYDKESRKELAEQLAISKELTAKAKNDESSDEEIDNGIELLKDALETAKENPWCLDLSSEVNEFVKGFKKFWSQTNKRDGPTKNENEKTVTIEPKAEVEKSENNLEKNLKRKSVKKNKTKNTKKHKSKEPTIFENSSGKWEVSQIFETKSNEKEEQSPQTEKRIDADIDEMFLVAEEKLSKQLCNKFTVLKKVINQKKSPKQKKLKKQVSVDSIRNVSKTSKTIKKPRIDEELIDVDKEPENDFATTSIKNPNKVANIDPQQFLKVKPVYVQLNVENGGNESGNDEIENEDAFDDEEKRQQIVMEAFADDEVVLDFQTEKKKEEKTTELEEAKSLPGWGVWAGVGIIPSKRRKTRPYVAPQLPKRKDAEKPDIIINEDANLNIVGHMVKEVPYPFKSVEDFEANLRTPISRDWQTERSVKALTEPAVRTLAGAIIEPMDSSVLINKKKRRSIYKGVNKN